MRCDNCQPTTKRENTSTTNATDHPAAMRLDVGAVNGQITKDQVCWSRPVQLQLTWSRYAVSRPRQARHTDDDPPDESAHCGGSHETAVARAPASESLPRRSAALGSRLPTPPALVQLHHSRAGAAPGAAGSGHDPAGGDA